jgi:hypothetical protein
MGLLNFYSMLKFLLAVHLKHCSFWLTADVKPSEDVLVCELHWLSMFALSLSLYVCVCFRVSHIVSLMTCKLHKILFHQIGLECGQLFRVVYLGKPLKKNVAKTKI